MEVIGIALFFVGGLFIGYKLTAIRSAIQNIDLTVKKQTGKEEAENKSVVVDPLDPVQQAKYERSRMMRQLNGEDYEE